LGGPKNHLLDGSADTPGKGTILGVSGQLKNIGSLCSGVAAKAIIHYDRLCAKQAEVVL